MNEVYLKLWKKGVIRSNYKSKINDTTIYKIELDEWKLAKESNVYIYCTDNEILYQSFVPIGACMLLKSGESGVLIDFNHNNGEHTVYISNKNDIKYSILNSDIQCLLLVAIGLEIDTDYGIGICENYNIDNDMYLIRLPFGLLYMHSNVITRSGQLPQSYKAQVLPSTLYLADKIVKISENIQNNLDNNDIALWLLDKYSTSNVTTIDEFCKNSLSELYDNGIIQANELQTKIDEKTKNTLFNDIEIIKSSPMKVATLLTELRKLILMKTNNAEVKEDSIIFQSDIDTINNLIDQLYQLLWQPSYSFTSNKITDITSNLADQIEKLDINFDHISNNVTNVTTNITNSNGIKILAADLRTLGIQYEKRTQLIISTLSRSQTYQSVEAGLSKNLQRLSIDSNNNNNNNNSIDSYDATISSNGSNNPLSVFEMLGLEKSTIAERSVEVFEATKRRLSHHLSHIDLQSEFIKNLDNRIENIIMECDFTNTSSMVSLSFLMVLIHEIDSTYLNPIINGNNYLNLKNQIENRLTNLLSSILRKANQNHITTSGSSGISGGRDLLKQIISPNLSTNGLQNYVMGWNNYINNEVNDINSINSNKKNKKIIVSSSSSDSNDKNDNNGIISMSDVVADIRSGKMTANQLKTLVTSVDVNQLDSDLAKITDQIMDSSESVISFIQSMSSHGSDNITNLIQQFDGVGLNLGSIDKAISQPFTDSDGMIIEAEKLLTNAEARDEFISSMKSQVVEFLMKFIPSMSIPDYEGDESDVEFGILDLDISGFKLKKEAVDIHIEDKADDFGIKFMGVSAREVSASFLGVRWRFLQRYFPHLTGEGEADAVVVNASVKLGFKMMKVPKNLISKLSTADSVIQKMKILAELEGTNNLVTNVSKARKMMDELESVSYSSNNNIGGNDDNNDMRRSDSNGSFNLKSEDIWGTINPNNIDQWEPALVLNSDETEVTMEALELRADKTTYAWLYNLMANYFSGIIKEYVCKNLEYILKESVSELLGSLNTTFQKSSSLITHYIGLDITNLPSADAFEVALLIGSPLAKTVLPKDYTLKISEHGYLGIQTIINPSSRVRKVLIDKIEIDTLAEEAVKVLGLKSYINGASIRSINGQNMIKEDADDIIRKLETSRPLFLGIRLSDTGYAELKAKRNRRTSNRKKAVQRKLEVCKVEFIDGPLGLKLKETKSCGGAVIVTGFAKDNNNNLLQAELSGKISIGDLILAVGTITTSNNDNSNNNNSPTTKINSTDVVTFGKSFNDIMEIVKKCKSAVDPLCITFVHSPDSEIVLNQFPKGLQLARISDHIMITALQKNNIVNNNDDNMSTDNRIKTGSIILQINNERLNKTDSSDIVLDCIINSINNSGQVSLAIRDMDSFMHLLRIRDGVENLESVINQRT